MDHGFVSRRTADLVAAAVFALVLGGVVVLGLASGTLLAGVDREPGTTTTSTVTVTEPAGPGDGPLPSPAPGTVTATTTTTTLGEPGLLDRVLGGPALWLVRLGFVALAAFLAAAVVQRVLLGRYEVKVGPVEVPPVITAGEVRRAGATVVERVGPQEAREARSATTLMEATDEPALRLVALRIEIERRVVQLLAASGVPRTGGLTDWIAALVGADVLDRDFGDALTALVGLGNAAAHGVAVERAAGDWAKEEGPLVLAALDDLVAARADATGPAPAEAPIAGRGDAPAAAPGDDSRPA